MTRGQSRQRRSWTHHRSFHIGRGVPSISTDTVWYIYLGQAARRQRNLPNAFSETRSSDLHITISGGQSSVLASLPLLRSGLLHRSPITRTAFTMAMNIHGIGHTYLLFIKDPRSTQADLRDLTMSHCRPSSILMMTSMTTSSSVSHMILSSCTRSFTRDMPRSMRWLSLHEIL